MAGTDFQTHLGRERGSEEINSRMILVRLWSGGVPGLGRILFMEKRDEKALTSDSGQSIVGDIWRRTYMSLSSSYNCTLKASYAGYVVQAIVNNFAPLLFLTFQDTFGIPWV